MDRRHPRLLSPSLIAGASVLASLPLVGCQRATPVSISTQAAIVPAPAPPTALQPVTDTYRGPNGPVMVTDNYRWLENAGDPSVKAWSEAQNLRARSYLSALRAREAAGGGSTAGALRSSGAATQRKVINAYFPIAQCPNGLFATATASDKQQTYLVLMPSEASPEAARTIFDPNVADPAGHTAIVFAIPSQSGKYVGVAEAKNGTEDGALHIYETATGRELPDQIARVTYPTGGGSIAWSGDDLGFFYTRYPRPGERTGVDEFNYQQVWYHRLGTPLSADSYAVGKEFPSIGEAKLEASRDGKFVLANVKNGDGGQHSFYVRGPAGKWDRLASNEDGIVEAHFGADGALYMLSRLVGGHGNGAVLRLPSGSVNLAQARAIVPESATAIDFILPTTHKLYVFSIDGGPSSLNAFDLDGSHRLNAPIPPVSSASGAVWVKDDTVLFEVRSYTAPSMYMEYSPGREQPTRTALLPNLRRAYTDIDVIRKTATSKDGTPIPLTILAKRNAPIDGGNPAIITGYGGYGTSGRPHLEAAAIRWCWAGGIYVYANIRGGGEYGEAWHRAGNLLKKQNVFDDFAACAQYLIDQGYSRASKIGALGVSNGGLLMGAQITQHPELYKCIVSRVGLYDMLRAELEPNGPTNTTEFGTVKNPAQFAALYAYSPYHHVTDGAHYPDVLMMTGDNDGRVDPMHSRKMMARLQAAAPGSILLLRTSATTGHGIGNSADENIEQNADQKAFFANELGLSRK